MCLDWLTHPETEAVGSGPPDNLSVLCIVTSLVVVATLRSSGWIVLPPWVTGRENVPSSRHPGFRGTCLVGTEQSMSCSFLLFLIKAPEECLLLSVSLGGSGDKVISL